MSLLILYRKQVSSLLNSFVSSLTDYGTEYQTHIFSAGEYLNFERTILYKIPLNEWLNQKFVLDKSSPVTLQRRYNSDIVSCTSKQAQPFLFCVRLAGSGKLPNIRNK